MVTLISAASAKISSYLQAQALSINEFTSNRDIQKQREVQIARGIVYIRTTAPVYYNYIPLPYMCNLELPV